jgi:SAM-dependent methyltransferase
MNNRKDFILEGKKAKSFFNLVSILYPFIELSLFPEYKNAVQTLDIDKNLKILDIATGTGILAGALQEKGNHVTGLDISTKLLKRAKKKFKDIEFKEFDLINLSEVQTNSYDIVSTGYFLHGISLEFRRFILKNMSRIASKYVIVFDYCCDGGLSVRFVEWLEGSDYIGFISSDMNKEFNLAGLKIEKTFQTSKIGKVWLCSKI